MQKMKDFGLVFGLLSWIVGMVWGFGWALQRSMGDGIWGYGATKIPLLLMSIILVVSVSLVITFFND